MRGSGAPGGLMGAGAPRPAGQARPIRALRWVHAGTTAPRGPGQAAGPVPANSGLGNVAAIACPYGHKLRSRAPAVLQRPVPHAARSLRYIPQPTGASMDSPGLPTRPFAGRQPRHAGPARPRRRGRIPPSGHLRLGYRDRRAGAWAARGGAASLAMILLALAVGACSQGPPSVALPP